ncbi:hypothetical protein Hamer_G030874, partial [Homarus americanus]
GSGPWQGEVCTLLYHTSCLTCTAVLGFSPPISGWLVIHNTTKGSRCKDTAQNHPFTPPLYLRNVVLNTGVPCCPRLCLLATALDFPIRLCSVLAALDGSALCLLPWTALLCTCCSPGRLCSVLAAPLDGSALCLLLPWTALLCTCCYRGRFCSVCAAALDGSAL